eukprot:TRINITY_DN15900_c0_g1_i1.p1 TRINITY_DN15900_c0_g1~~TRINITY_DN15900_c0_g1_i1.p1  ORF type:complete len:305 (+),score=80.59 TRINITY_DN15900_c0_g1_i1:35-916(+)
MALRFLLSLGDKYAPVLRSSKFKEEGQLTPDEFVVAGQQLVHMCGTWSWETGDKKSARDYLPAQHQFLITRKVPCRMRAKISSQSVERDIDDGEGGDSWTLTHADQMPAKEEDVPDAQPAPKATAAPVFDDDDDDDDVPDADDYLTSLGAQRNDDNDAASLEPQGKLAVEKHRTYDVSITYDNWYKTPRVWLYGYDEYGRPLSSEQMLEDISSDHADKTVTVENHPHLNIPHVSIHPCQHAHVMKTFIDSYESTGRSLRVDQYLFLFIKLLSAVIPTIDYDFTVDMDAIKISD